LLTAGLVKGFLSGASSLDLAKLLNVLLAYITEAIQIRANNKTNN